MLLTIAGVIAAVAVINAVFPAVMRSSSALTTASGNVDERIKTNISVVQSVGELDTGGSFVDTNSNSLFDFYVWVKNVGSVTVPAPEESDVFFGQPGSIVRIPYVDDSPGTYPNWTYTVEGGGDWDVASTVRIEVRFDDGCPGACSQPQGDYFVRVITPNGVATESYFSM
jgi:flagellar protein FlaG